MGIQWTGPMLKQCLELRNEFGIKSAAKKMKLTGNQVRGALSRISGGTGSNRKYYAEDVAEIFQLRFGFGASVKRTASITGIPIESLKYIIKTAKKNGFDAYPPRNSQ
jgi:hypothetical protein